jgi:quercetin dioxygenase-like cupin family protein
MNRALLALALTLTVVAGAAQAELAQRRLAPADIAALDQGGAGPGTSGIQGIRTTVLAGDPTKPGPYTIALQVPAETRIAAHTHRDDRSAVVVKGTWYFGYGPTADDRQAKALPPGSYYTEPAGQPHFAHTGSEPVTVYISGVGPTDTVYGRD